MFSFFSTPIHTKEDLDYTIVILTESPDFIKNVTRKGNTSYELILTTDSGKFELDGIDYKYLKSDQFRKNVKNGDKLELGILDDKVFTIRKENIDYLQFEKAQFHKQKNRLFIRYLFILPFIICVVTLFLKEHPKIKLNDGSYWVVDFKSVFLFTFIVTFILLLVFIGPSFISSGEFIE